MYGENGMTEHPKTIFRILVSACNCCIKKHMKMTMKKALFFFAAMIFPFFLNVAAVMAQSSPKSGLTVFAAASLTESFREIGKTFERAHPDVEVTFNFGGSPQLARQILDGAQADIAAFASAKQLRPLAQAKLIHGRAAQIFVHNRLVIITPSDNSAGIHSIDDLARPGLKITFADSSVPAGQYALQFLDNAAKSRKDLAPGFREQVLKNVISYEENVKAVYNKVLLGECDAGIVYASDISRDSSRRVQQIPISNDQNIVADYFIAVLNTSRVAETAKTFVDFVLAHEGQEILSRYGFQSVINTDSTK